MIISFSRLGGGGGGYVLPTATANRLGGIKVGSGLSVDSGGTLSAEGGGDYVIVDDLSAVTNPQEGMIAYVKSHTALTDTYTVYKVDLAGVDNVSGWMSINNEECIYLEAYDGGVQSLRLDNRGEWDLAGQWLNQWVRAEVSYHPSVVHAWMFDGSILNIAVEEGGSITEARYGTISATTGTYSETITIPGASFIYNSGWTPNKTTVVINEMTGAERIQLCTTLRANTNAFFNYDLVYVDDSDRGTGVRLTSYRSGENWQGYDWFGGYCNWDGGKYFINVTVNTDDGSMSADVSGVDIPPVAQCKKFNIDVDSAGTETLYTNGISPEQVYAFAHELAGYERTDSKPLYLIAGQASESWYTDSIDEMKIYRNHAQAVAAREGTISGALENAVTVEGRFFNYVTEKWRKLTIASVYQDGTWGWDTPTIVDE